MDFFYGINSYLFYLKFFFIFPVHFDFFYDCKMYALVLCYGFVSVGIAIDNCRPSVDFYIQ